MGSKEDWGKVMKSDPTGWLLEKDNPVVRYWALRYLESSSREDVEKAGQEAMRSELVQEILAQQKQGGHWESPSNMHAPHYTSTVYQLTLLADLGETVENERVIDGVEAVLRTQHEDGSFPGHDPKRCFFGPFDSGLIVRFMHKFGMDKDSRLGRILRWIEENQTPEGGWVGVRGRCNPLSSGCLNGSVSVLWGLAATGKYEGTKVAQRGVEFLSRALEAPRLRYGRYLSYPQFWNFWVDDIKLAEIYMGLGIRVDDKRVRSCLDTILRHQEKEGWWLEEGNPYPGNNGNCKRMRRFFPVKNEPSKWVTAKAMIVLRQAHTESTLLH